MLFFKLSANRYDLGLSNEPLFIIIAQGAAKPWPVKVGSQRQILLWAHLNPFLLSKSGAALDLSLTSNLTGHSFVAPWAKMMKWSSFESPKPYLTILNKKNSIVPLLTSVRMCWKMEIYYINRVLMILNRTPLYWHSKDKYLIDTVWKSIWHIIWGYC